METHIKVPLYPNEELRNKLAKLGVPRYRHNLAELGEMLPKSIKVGGELSLLKHNKWHYGYCILTTDKFDLQDWSCKVKAETEVDARAKMLIYLIENGLITL